MTALDGVSYKMYKIPPEAIQETYYCLQAKNMFLQTSVQSSQDDRRQSTV